MEFIPAIVPQIYPSIGNQVKENMAPFLNMGFNATNEKYEDMIKSGILDPTSVSSCALALGEKKLFLC